MRSTIRELRPAGSLKTIIILCLLHAALPFSFLPLPSQASSASRSALFELRFLHAPYQMHHTHLQFCMQTASLARKKSSFKTALGSSVVDRLSSVDVVVPDQGSCSLCLAAVGTGHLFETFVFAYAKRIIPFDGNQVDGSGKSFEVWGVFDP